VPLRHSFRRHVDPADLPDGAPPSPGSGRVLNRCSHPRRPTPTSAAASSCTRQHRQACSSTGPPAADSPTPEQASGFVFPQAPHKLRGFFVGSHIDSHNATPAK
jgi:hypothetical protein